ncbi:VWA domain-containing protein [bacterium]|nr:VWA domain-containing protein [bacterium]
MRELLSAPLGGQITFATPELFLLFPIMVALPFLRRWWAKPPSRPSLVRTRAEVEVARRDSFHQLSRVFPTLLFLVFIGCLVAAAAQPQRQNILDLSEHRRRNIMVAMDVSRSMDAPDFRTPDGRTKRIEGVKSVTKDFIARRTGDRIGLVLFGSRAYLQAPLTIDYLLLYQLVDAISLGVAGDGTAIGDGLGVALKKVEALPAEARAIILLTDGVSNSGRIEPMKAARIAADLNVKVYTIGIGSPEGSTVQIPQGGLLRYQQVRAEFDEETLREIASLTGGKYYFASDLNALDLIYREIDALEHTEAEERSFAQTEELSSPLVTAALISFLLHLLITQTIIRVLP